MKTYISKFILFHIFILSLTFLLISCKSDRGGALRNPNPSENPVYLTEEAQTKELYVEHLAGLNPENPKTDKTYWNEADRLVVENEWITFTYLQREVISITVKENTSNEPRKYNLPMHGTPGRAILHVIQNEKIGN